MSTKTASATENAPPAKRRRRPMKEVTALLLEAATEEFKRCGFASATTAAIARRAGATEAQLFRYFGSKSELFREAIFNELDRHFTEFNARHQAGETDAVTIRDLTRLYIHELYQFLSGHADLLLSLFVAQTYAPDQSPRVEEIDSLRVYFERGAAMVDRSGARATRGAEPRMLVRMSFGAVLAGVMFKGWLFPGNMADEAEIEEATIDFVINGIGEALDAQAQRPQAPAA